MFVLRKDGKRLCMLCLVELLGLSRGNLERRIVQEYGGQRTCTPSWQLAHFRIWTSALTKYGIAHGDPGTHRSVARGQKLNTGEVRPGC